MQLTIFTALLALTSIDTTLAGPMKRYSNKGPQLSRALQSILDNTHNSPSYTYPTDLTQGIIPKPIHSHNDYWRKVPFYTALSNGVISVEADVWLVNQTLYVGHDQLSLSQTRTFSSLYIQPILNTLNRQNPTTNNVLPAPNKYGVFDTDPSQTLYLFVDVKTNGPETWPAVVQALEPLRSAGYLSHYDGTNTVPGAVTVIGTGNTPLDQIITPTITPRDYFYDANLALLNTTQSNITSTISPIASTSFQQTIGRINGTQFSASQLQTIQDQIATARAKGIGARYWETPAYPISTRNTVWQTLEREGVTLLNADDLSAAAGYADLAPW